MGEKNKVRWVGIRPIDPPETIPVEEQSPLTEISVKPVSPRQAIPIQPYGDFGTQIVKYAWVENATAIIHTVSAGKTLHLCSIALSVDAVADGRGRMFVRDDSDTIQYYFFRPRRPAGNGEMVGLTFNPPLKISEGWDICVWSENADFHLIGFIFGYEV